MRRKRGMTKEQHQKNKKVLLKENYDIDIALIDYYFELKKTGRDIERLLKECEDDDVKVSEIEEVKILLLEAWKVLNKTETLLLNKLDRKKELFYSLEQLVSTVKSSKIFSY